MQSPKIFRMSGFRMIAAMAAAMFAESNIGVSDTDRRGVARGPDLFPFRAGHPGAGYRSVYGRSGHLPPQGTLRAGQWHQSVAQARGHLDAAEAKRERKCAARLHRVTGGFDWSGGADRDPVFDLNRQIANSGTLAGTAQRAIDGLR